MEYIKNPHGFKVRKACVSCRFFGGREYDKTVGSCSLHKEKKGWHDSCREYQMRENVKEVGCDEQGRVHKKEWLQFLAEHAEDFQPVVTMWRSTEENGELTQLEQHSRVVLARLIEEFEAVHGSRFEDM